MGADQGLTRLFYDGGCGLCHGLARFVARHDRTGKLRFAPLRGETFTRRMPPENREGLPDSLVVLSPEGSLLTRSGAAIHLLLRMGPGWRACGLALGWVPSVIRDAAYDLLARHRPRRQVCAREDRVEGDRFDP